MGRVAKILLSIVPIAVALWGLYAIVAQVTYAPGGRRRRRPGRWVYGAEAVRLGILWIVIASYIAAELWAPEGMITRPVRVLMGLALFAIAVFLFVAIP